MGVGWSGCAGVHPERPKETLVGFLVLAIIPNAQESAGYRETTRGTSSYIISLTTGNLRHVPSYFDSVQTTHPADTPPSCELNAHERVQIKVYLCTAAAFVAGAQSGRGRAKEKRPWLAIGDVVHGLPWCAE